ITEQVREWRTDVVAQIVSELGSSRLCSRPPTRTSSPGTSRTTASTSTCSSTTARSSSSSACAQASGAPRTPGAECSPTGRAPPTRTRRRHRRGNKSECSRLDEAAADCVTGELDAVAHPELVEDVLAVTLDGLDADEEQLRDLFGRVRLGDQFQHLELARGQDVELLLAASTALDVIADKCRDR